MVTFEAYQLTCFDHLFSLFYGGCALSFHISCPEEAVPILCGGLERLVSHLPFLAGKVSQSGKIAGVHPIPTTTSGSSPPIAVVRHFPKLRLLYKPGSRSQLCRDYIRDESLILAPYELCSRAGTPVARFQINVLADGIILVPWVNHMAIDGIGVDNMTRALSICCQADDNPLKARQLPTDPSVEADTRAVLANFARSQTNTIANSGTETDGPPTLGEGEHNVSSLVDYNFCFAASKVERLRNCVRSLWPENKDSDQPIPRISCDDIVTVFIWIALTSLRQDGMSINHGTMKSTLTRAVDIRNRFSNPIPSTYFGNCVVLLKESLPLEVLQWRNNLPGDDDQKSCSTLAPVLHRAADVLRSRLQSLDDQYIREIFSSPHLPDADPGPNVFVSSLRHLSSYKHDFGPVLGRAKGFHLLPYMRPDGVCTIMPKQLDQDNWDIMVTLNPKDMELLRQDAWFQWMSETTTPITLFESL